MIDPASGPEGKDDFLLPYIGLRLERSSDVSSFFGSVSLETNVRTLAGTDDGQIERLGREQVEGDFVLLNWNFFGSMYLETLLEDVDLKGPRKYGTLAHELALSCRGQVTFDDRVIPQFKTTAGGLYSVRGYPEALTSGDNVVIGGIEYRYHLPRTLPIQPDPTQTPLFGEPFRVSPQRPFGHTDWDLIFKAFVDYAYVHNSDIDLSGGVEDNETLLSAGVGLDFLLKRNLSLRADWGVALRDAEEVTEGSSQFHFVAMILY